MRLLLVYALCIASVYIPKAQESSQEEIDSLFKTVKWRNIGPFRGGRSVCGHGVNQDPFTYYMGTTGGGLWKTSDAGITWSNISDGFFNTSSVGAIAVAPSDPNVIYVGMGEHAVRGVMTSHGDGVYKSTDAGKTWTKQGLDKTQHIARIVIHPDNPDIAYVAAQGSLYSPSKERGIYKTIDGGKSWECLLFIDNNTGCAELSMDANNPRILYAAMWEYGRKPWQVISGGPGSGLYKSTDSGQTWHKMTDGLPPDMGKMAVSVCPSQSEKVYALIEGDSNKENGGLFMSTDSGNSWNRITNDHRLVQRAWYYIELFVDPKNENIIYVLSATAYKSIDGGKTWEELSGTHGDYHDLWINPSNPLNMAISDDGGTAITFNGGISWSSQNNMPTAQIYRLTADNLFPYNIYGGQQDNSSIKIQHRSISSNIDQKHWTYSAGGESAFLAFDPDDPSFVMGGSYMGTIEYLDVEAGVSTKIMAAPIQYLALDSKDMKYRYNWNAPIIKLKHEPNSYIHAAQLLLKTRDNGQSWAEISPDLTRNDKTKQGKGGVPFTNESVGAENYGTIAYVAESPHEPQVLYTGSDDGLVHLTKDGGKTWTNITPKGLQECLINAIEVSPHDKATAYIATTRYKFNDHSPGIYKTTNYGQSWEKITNGIPNNTFTRVVREDSKIKNLLFAGTEYGVYISWNGGQEWHVFKLNFPVTPVTDLIIHQNDLIAATMGRSFWILDDLNVIRSVKTVPTKFTVIEPEPSYLMSGSSPLNKTDKNFKGMSTHTGVNPANGVVLYYYIPQIDTSSILTCTITNDQGKIINYFNSIGDTSFVKWEGGPSETPKLMLQSGVNRFVWNMRHKTLPGVPNTYYENSFNGHKVPPGRYTATFKYNEEEVSTNIDILANPKYNTSAEEYQEYDKIMTDMEQKVAKMHHMVNDLYNKNKKLGSFLLSLDQNPNHQDIIVKGKELSKEMKHWDQEMVQRLLKAYDDVENFENKFAANYMFLMNATESEIPRVNQGSRDEKKRMDMLWTKLQAKGEEFLQIKLPQFNQLVCEKGLGGI